MLVKLYICVWEGYELLLQRFRSFRWDDKSLSEVHPNMSNIFLEVNGFSDLLTTSGEERL